MAYYDKNPKNDLRLYSMFFRQMSNSSHLCIGFRLFHYVESV